MSNNTDKKSSGWKYVVLDEIPGVMMGIVGTLMSAESFAARTMDLEVPAGDGNDPLVPVAEVDDAMSFADAFADARSEVGAGGVFAWRGNVYNTFYKEEWEGMSDEQKEEFVENYRNSKVEIPEYDQDDYTSEDYEENEFEDGDEDFELEELDIDTVPDEPEPILDTPDTDTVTSFEQEPIEVDVLSV